MRDGYNRIASGAAVCAVSVLFMLVSMRPALAANGDMSIGGWVGLITGTVAFLISLGTVVYHAATKMNATELIKKDAENIKAELQKVEKHLEEKMDHFVDILEERMKGDRNVLVQQLAAFKLEVKEDVRNLVSREIGRCPHAASSGPTLGGGQ